MKRLVLPALCANDECACIFLPPPYYEQLSSFCPECRRMIQEEVAAVLGAFEDIEDGPTH